MKPTDKPESTSASDTKPAAAAPAPIKTPAPKRPADTDALVERWFRDHVHNSPLARNTEFHNLLHTAKEDLKRLLKEAL